MNSNKECICGHFELEHIFKKTESIRKQLGNHSKSPGYRPRLFDNIIDQFRVKKLVCEKCDCESFKDAT